jgi:predicted small lipoprotein YifL
MKTYLYCLAIILGGLTSVLSGCGQKGPLYLPEETSSRR